MTQEQLLKHYRPWILAVARDINGSPGWRIQDLAQEAWIEIWRRLTEDTWNKKLPLDLALKLHAKDRMRTVFRSWQTTTSQANQPSVDQDWQLEEILNLATTLDNLEWAYHRGQIYRVMNEVLSAREREYVYLRFWCGYQLPQMRAHFGYNPSSLWRTARTKLGEALISLVSV